MFDFVPQAKHLRASFHVVGAVAALAVIGASLAGCSSDPKKGQACPEVRIDRATSSLSQFREGNGRDLTDVQFQVELADYQGDCEFAKDESSVTVRFKALFAVTRGPAFTGETGKFQYFAAIPAFHPLESAKQVMPVTFKFPEGNVNTIFLRDEEVRITVPLKDKTTKETPIYLGLQLDPDQLDYNRKSRRAP